MLISSFKEYSFEGTEQILTLHHFIDFDHVSYWRVPIQAEEF